MQVKVLKCSAKLFKISVLCGLVGALMACQNTSSTAPVKGYSNSSQERPLKLIKSSDGLQDITWQITHIETQPTQRYRHVPYLKLNAAQQRLEGHTGCNLMHGTYRLNTTQNSLTIEAKAGHYSCEQALAQEAELAHALAQVVRYQLQGAQLILLDQRGRSLIVAKK